MRQPRQWTSAGKDSECYDCPAYCLETMPKLWYKKVEWRCPGASLSGGDGMGSLGLKRQLVFRAEWQRGESCTHGDLQMSIDGLP